MLKHLPLVLSFSILALTTAEHPIPPDYRFRVEVLAEGMVQPMELEVAPDRRVFFNELGGKLKIYNPATRAVALAGEIPVFTEQENGFLGFALDPGFATNNYIYLFYSPKNFEGARLSRFTMAGDQLQYESEKMILQFGEQRRECCHHAGSVEFGPEGDLYISTGDNTHPGGDSAGYAPIDERSGREPYDAQKASANTHDLRGKILRIRVTPDGSYTIPEGNLFPEDGSKGRPEIYVMGCRNPWRLSVDQRTGIIYWGDVGPDAGGDGPRGSRGYDEINQARKAGNFGWPYFVGTNFPYADYDFATQSIGPLFDPLRPTNASPNNTGSLILPPAQPALIYWPYGESKEFPMLGSGGRTACAGPVFHFDPAFKDSGGFPQSFDKCLLFFDWQRPFMKWARLDQESKLQSIEPFTAAVAVVNDRDQVRVAQQNGRFVIQRPIDAQFGPDGCLYLLDYGETWGVNKDSRLLKISYLWGNVPPVAKIQADRHSGGQPLQINLSGEGSFDHEGDPLEFTWLLHPGGKEVSRVRNLSLQLTNTGNYVLELKVDDGRGGSASANLPVVVGNQAPQIAFTHPHAGDFFSPGQTLDYQTHVRDAEDGDSTQLDELFDAKVFVTATWFRGDKPIDALDPGLAAMKQSDCFNCHALEQKIVGPSFLDIANRYRNQDDALETSVQRVLRGSSGIWSEVPMLPHESLNPDQVRMMVRFILGTQPGQGGPTISKGLSGRITVPADEKITHGVLEASYTDHGNPPAGALSAKTEIRIRSRRLQAEEADLKQGLKVLGSFLGAIDHGHYARFDNVNLGQSSAVRLRVSSGGQGGKIELRAGTLNGHLLGEVTVEPTGGWDQWTELETTLVNTEKRTLYVIFSNPGKGGLMNLDWLELKP